MGRKFFDNGSPIPSLEEVLGNLRPLTWAQKVERVSVDVKPVPDFVPQGMTPEMRLRVSKLGTMFRQQKNRPKKVDVFWFVCGWVSSPKQAQFWLRRDWPRLTGLGLQETLEYPTRLCIVPSVPSHRWFLSLPLSGAGASVPEHESRPSSPSSGTPGSASEPT